MSFVSRPLWALLFAALLLPLAACDETGSVSANVETAVEDAVIARQTGDYAAAVALLEDAFEREPDNATVRVELATTILERDDIDLLDVDRIASYVAGGFGSAAPSPTTSEARGTCAVAADPTATEFDPTAIAGFSDLTAGAATIDQAIDLLAPIIPSEISGFSICSSVADGALDYDADAAIAALRARGLSDARVAQVLAVNALSKLIDAYLFVSVDIPSQTTWYRLADGSITVCADDAEALQAQAEGAIADFGQAVLALDARASLLGDDSAASDLVDLAVDAFEDLRDAIGEYCASA